MNNILVSIGGIILVVTVMSLIGRFFGIALVYYLPFMAWFTAIFIFNMFLEKKHQNVFMADILNY